MPTILRLLGFRFFFYSNEGNEPPHIHIEKGDASGKYWLDPLSKEQTDGFTKAEERDINQILERYQQEFQQKWHEHFNKD